MSQSIPDQNQDGRGENPIKRLSAKIDAMRVEVREEIQSLRRDVIGTDAHTAAKSLVARVTALEVRIANVDTSKGRFAKIIDHVAGQLLTALIVVAVAALVFFKSLPPDAATRIHSIPPTTTMKESHP